MPGLLGDFGSGLINAGAALNPIVMQGQQRQQQLQQEQQFAQARQMVQHVVQGVQSGAIDPQQGRAVLQRMGIDLPVGPDIQTQVHQQQQQVNQQAMQWLQQRQQQPPEGESVGMGLGASLKDVPPQFLSAPVIQNALKLQDMLATHENLRQTRADNVAARQDALAQRADEARQRAEDRRLSLEDRQTARQQHQDLVREMAAARREGGRDRAPSGYRFTGDGNLEAIPGGPGDKSRADAPGDFDKTGEEFLQSLPAADRAFVKKLANYEIDPRTLSTRGGERERLLKQAVQYDSTFDQKNYNTISQAVNKFATGPQGNTVRSLNVAIEHMDTARKLGDALKNGDYPLINRLGNEFATQTGKPAPTNFNAVKEIVADEVVKGVIGGAGALQDREAAAKKIRDASSPAQMKGVLDSWTELLSGQIKGLEKQYEGATNRKDFREKYMTPRTREAVGDKTGGGGKVVKFSDLKP